MAECNTRILGHFLKPQVRPQRDWKQRSGEHAAGKDSWEHYALDLQPNS